MTLDELQITPDAEQIVIQYLLGIDEITDIVVEEIRGVMKDRQTFPCVLVRQIGGFPVTQRPLYLDRALIQVDVYGGPKRTARRIASYCRAALAADDFTGVHELGDGTAAVVTGVEFGTFRWLPDADLLENGVAIPRYIFDVAVYSHAQASAASS